MLYSLPLKTLAGCSGRYPTAAEEEAVLGYAASVPARLKAANAFAQKDQAIVRAALELVKPKYPRFAPQHDRTWDKTFRDVLLLSRYAIQGMVADDTAMPDDKLYVWLGTIMRGHGMTQELIRDCLAAVAEVAPRQLPADAAALAGDYLSRLVEDMSNFQDPLKPAVH
jgi:hypothetical protein